MPLDIVARVGGQHLQGHISERRSTYDGRVQIRKGLLFFTARAELFQQHVVEAGRSNEGQRRRVDASRFHASSAGEPSPGHVALCDPYLAAGTVKNPYACRYKGRPADCYDVSVLQVVHGSRGPQRSSELWTTPVTITVRSPKTRNAAVANVEVRGDPVRSPIPGTPGRSGVLMFEPVISGDGRLLILNSGDTLLYSVIRQGGTPCDARGWERLAHVSKMHRDPAMARYGIARYPIRDTENRKVKNGRPLRGAYPWIDREGKNLFFTQVAEVGLYYRNAKGKMRTRFEVLNRLPKREVELARATRFGMSFFGLWSQGKIVVPDTRLNNVDFKTSQRGYRPEVALYRDDPEGVELGPAGIVDINSAENQWNYRAAFSPRSPRDVVWWLSASTGMTGEVVFDDALDVGGLIYSPMNASVNNKKRAWRDGFDYKRLTGYSQTPRIQNAAASELRWKVPSYGKLVDARPRKLSKLPNP